MLDNQPVFQAQILTASLFKVLKTLYWPNYFYVKQRIFLMNQIKIVLINFLAMLVLSFSTSLYAEETVNVLMKTSKGDITLELYPDKAPITVENFVKYAEDNFYNKTIFHRVIKNFMIQGGGFVNPQDKKAFQGAPIKNEADNGLKNDRGTIAMARTRDPQSATTQFFINTKNNDFLNHTRKTMNGWGYTVFGKVTSGMDVVDKISNSKTTTSAGRADVPVDPIYIEDVSIIKSE